MSWTKLSFGKYMGRTLPEIIVLDPDWFFWMLPKLYGKIGNEAQDLARKAKSIKIPHQGGRLTVEYRYEDRRRFCGFAFVEIDNASFSRWSIRLPYLDLSFPLRRNYDKQGGRIVVRDFRNNYFGERKRLTRQRCENFFGDGRNFMSNLT